MEVNELLKEPKFKNLFYEIISDEIDEELEKNILKFINEEVAVEVEDLFDYFHSIPIENVLVWLEEYQAKWNPESKIFEFVKDQIEFYNE